MKAKEETREEEIHLKGAPVSEGIAIGIPIFLTTEKDDIPEFPITTGEVEGEILRYRRALSSSRDDLKKLQANLASEGSDEVVSIIDTHIQMLEDPLMTTHMEKKIREMLKNTEAVFESVVTDYQKKFSLTPDSFFQQRMADVKDLSQRVLRNLCHPEKVSFDEIPPNAIIFAKELIPSDTASIQASRVSAFVTQSGGGTSHAALIARAKGIPYVASIDVEALQNAQGKCVIVDGLTGDIIVNPTNDTLEKYQKLRRRLMKQYQQMEKDRHLPAETIDGYLIDVCANINALNDVDLVHHHAASGIGLFRSEYLFLQDTELFFNEEVQTVYYRQLLEKAQGLATVVRVFDIGGDKYPQFLGDSPKEPNPVLGLRGIRFLMRRKDLFKIQLRAIYRASVYGNVRILLPMIADIYELREVKELVKQVKAELKSENIPFKDSIPLGSMVEVPSAVLICDSLAQECDFLAIGTNDLVQYTLGIDRCNLSLSDFYSPIHPSVLRMIKMVVLEGKRFRKPVTICGEIASNPLFTPLLLGLGIQKFSCAPRFIPIIKRTVRQYTLLDACQIAEHALTLKTSLEISNFLLNDVQGSTHSGG